MLPYPAVAEAEARGATATLFAAIRRALGVPVVNQFTGTVIARMVPICAVLRARCRSSPR